MRSRYAISRHDEGWILWAALLFLAIVGGLAWVCTAAAIQQLHQASGLVAEVSLNARAEHLLQQLAERLTAGEAPVCRGVTAGKSEAPSLEYLIEGMRIDGLSQGNAINEAYRITVQTQVGAGDIPKRWQGLLAVARVEACERVEL